MKDKDTAWSFDKWASWWNRFPQLMERYRDFARKGSDFKPAMLRMLEFLQSMGFKIELQPIGVNDWVGHINLPTGQRITNKVSMPKDLAAMDAVEYCLAWQFDHESKIENA